MLDESICFPHNTKFYVTFTCGGTFTWPIITEYDGLRYLYMWRHFHLTHHYRIQSSTLPLHVAALSSDPSLQNTMFYSTFTCGGTFIWPIITEYEVLLYLYMWRHFHLTHQYIIRLSTLPLHVAALSSDPSLHNTMSTVPLHVVALSSDPSLQNTMFYVTFTCGGTFIWPINT